MKKLTEKRDVQDQIINHLIAIGWRYIPPDDVTAMRANDDSEPFLPGLLRQKLIELNPGLVTDANVDDVIRRLRQVAPDLAGNETILNALRGRWTVYDDAAKVERNLTLVNYDKPKENNFSFTQEFRFVGQDARRPDMVLFVNGLPVVVIENKSPTIKEPEVEAFDQVQYTYTERIPEFLKFVQVFAAAATRLHYGPTWNDDVQALYTWKAGGKEYGLETLSQTLFSQEQVLRLLRDYVIFFRADDQTHKFVLRPHQIRASERIIKRVSTQEADAGLLWHTQGSGKTLTMIVAANKLRRLEKLDNPTILIVVDRLELEGQMVQNLEAFGFPMVTRAENKRHLRDLLKSDYRGLIVTLIHKFDDAPKDLNTRNNVIVLIDEAHRSQEGDLGIYMRAALPNAVYFGFTGTPVDKGKVGKGTFETFGKPDPGGYLDKYAIDESVADGTTVRLWYTLAPSELRVDRKTLEEEFFNLVDEMGVASIEELNRLLDRADKLKAVLKAPERVEAIAAHVAQHYTQNIEPQGFKAFLVAVDREACALYKEALDRHLPPDYSRVVYTPGHKDGELLRKYHLEDNEEKQIRKAFRDPAKLPKILIVTEKLLTGYDAPVLSAMYLDKPLKDHTLLQAIARVNRPYPNKDGGLLLDYIGIFENLQRALSFDQESIAQALIELGELKKQFVELLTGLEEMLAPLDLESDLQDRSGRIMEFFADTSTREDFIQRFRAMQAAYETISPDPFLYDYLDRYTLIAQVYQAVYVFYDPEAERRRLRHALLKKTDALIRENVELVSLAEPLPLYPINKDIATVIAADSVDERVKVINLYRSLISHVEQNQLEQPYLVTLGEYVEKIIQRLHDRQISAQTALSEITDKAEEMVRAGEEQAKSGLPGQAFAYSWVLRGSGLTEDQAQTVSQQIETVLNDHATWPYNAKVKGLVRLELYKLLNANLTNTDAKQLKGVADNLLQMHRMVDRSGEVVAKQKPEQDASIELKEEVPDYDSIKLSDLRLDVAVPDKVQVGVAFNLAIAIKQIDSALLAVEYLPLVKSGPITVQVFGSPFIRLRIEISAPHCKIDGEASQYLRVYPDQDSGIFYFHLVPLKQGFISIIVKAYQEDDWIGNVQVCTKVYEKVVGDVKVDIKSVSIHDIRKHRPISLQHQLTQHYANRNKLQEDAAIFGAGQVPLSLQNQIEAEERAIEAIGAEIKTLLEQKLDD